MRDGSDIIEFVFDSPINAKLVIKDKMYDIQNGAVAITVSESDRGECAPRIYSGGVYTDIESFIIGVGVMRKHPDADYIKSLSDKIFALKNKMKELEKRISYTEEKIDGKPIF